jgi:Tetratricopeptide repeat
VIGWLLAAALAPTAGEPAYTAALDLAYAGETERALERLATLAAGPPADPLAAALEGLVLAGKIEQRPESVALDKDLHRLLDGAIAQADARLREEPGDARALLARGAAHGVRSRLHLFRLQKPEAARAAVRMREDLLQVLERQPGNGDALFGLGLYDYYADVLPRMTKLLRFLAGIPGGDRERGLLRIRAAERTAAFYSTEATIQLFQIDSLYEKDPDQALQEIEALRRRYPASTQWALLLARHQRDELGLYAESATVAREILDACARGVEGFGSGVEAMARVSLGHSLLLDLRLADARRALLPVKDGIPEAFWVGPTARLLLGRSLELEGDREAALAHYRRASEGSDRGVRRRAREALSSPLSAGEVRGTQLLGEARRHREAGRREQAAKAFRLALDAWPRSQEARVRVAEEEVALGRGAEGRGALREIAEQEDPQPPWTRAWARLLLGRLHDLAGDRAAAVRQYEMVFKAPSGLEELRRLAADGLEGPYSPESGPRYGPRASLYSR